MPALSKLQWRLDEFWRLFRFATVGILVTVLYTCMTLGLTQLVGMQAVMASVIGHVVAASASYAGHYFISFRSQQEHPVALPRFLIFVAFSLALNAAGTWGIVDVLHLPVIVSVAAIGALIIALGYLSGRFWIFMSSRG